MIGFVTFVFRPRRTPRWIQKTPWAAKASAFAVEAMHQIASERRLFFEATTVQFIVRMIDGATVNFAFLAIGAPVDYGICLVGVVIGSVSATIGLIPMGLDTFEAGMIASLTVFGVPVEDALTATLVYRGLSLWLPLIPGFLLFNGKCCGLNQQFLRSRNSLAHHTRRINKDQELAWVLALDCPHFDVIHVG